MTTRKKMIVIGAVFVSFYLIAFYMMLTRPNPEWKMWGYVFISVLVINAIIAIVLSLKK